MNEQAAIVARMYEKAADHEAKARWYRERLRTAETSNRDMFRSWMWYHVRLSHVFRWEAEEFATGL